VAFSLIILLLYTGKLLSGKGASRQEGRLFINITTDVDDLGRITQILSNRLPYVELKRLDTLDKGLDLSFLCKANSLEDISLLKSDITQLSEATRLSIIDQPELIL
ncbi:MAG TPA: hypothetical protein PLU64_13795, partial [Saprospiraceae bacterium]|nr:hypothetical protein [Saprospiraceae bacterium]